MNEQDRVMRQFSLVKDRNPSSERTVEHTSVSGSGRYKNYARRGEMGTRNKWKGYVGTRHTRQSTPPPKTMRHIRQLSQKIQFVATSLYDTGPPLATLLHPLKGLKLVESLGGSNKGYSSIKNISIDIEG